MIFKSLSQYQDAGLLIIRLGLGIMFILHGQPKLFGGVEAWESLGAKGMGALGVNVAPAFWGFMAGFAEFAGGILLILGFFFRPACLLLLFTMIVAATTHLVGGDGIKVASHAIEAGVVFLGLFFIGPGKYSLDSK